jgi:hypothetical protein
MEVNISLNIPASLFHISVVSRKRAAYHTFYGLPHETIYIPSRSDYIVISSYLDANFL